LPAGDTGDDAGGIVGEAGVSLPPQPATVSMTARTRASRISNFPAASAHSMRLQSENCRDARNTVATSTAPAFRRYTTRYRPTMISRMSGTARSGTARPDSGNTFSRSTASRLDEQSSRHTAVNRGRCTRESLQDPETLAATRSAPSHAKPTFDLVVWDALASIEFLESSLDFGEKHQALDRIVNGGVRRKLPQSLDHAITRICGRHIDFYCNADQFGRELPTPCHGSVSLARRAAAQPTGRRQPRSGSLPSHCWLVRRVWDAGRARA